MYLDLDDIAETLKNARNHGVKCCVLTGAGCSVSAGIPDANGFVKIIEERYPVAYKRASEKKYFECMKLLSPGDRHSLITEGIKQSKLNWGHIALAQLMKADYVDRVLTTNFDSLLLQACALIGGIQPAVYDIPSSKEFNASMVSTPAIFHLHGQSSGFILINTPEEYTSQSALIEPVIKDVLRDHVWIVIGYSGENDPTFEYLVNNPVFDQRLYWVGFEDSEPTENLREKLLSNAKETHYIKGYDSDSFFGKLAGKLSCFPPEFVSKPFTYLDRLFDSLTPYAAEKTIEPINYVQSAKRIIRQAIKMEKNNQNALQAMSDLMGERYSQVSNVKVIEQPTTSFNQREFDQARVWALFLEGENFSDQARAVNGEKADALYSQAYEKYAAALQIKPDFHEALNNWGIALRSQANTKSNKEAEALYRQANEKYAAALKIKSDFYEALYNWGTVLSIQAKTKSGSEADALYIQAYEKFAAALDVIPDKHEALFNWGTALSTQAKIKSDAEADALYSQAYSKFAAALLHKQDKHEVLYNWGNALSDQANIKNGAEADVLYNSAYEKYIAALQIKPDFYEALHNWGVVLSDQAQTKSGAEADTLYRQAYEKFAATQQIKPSSYGTLNIWGNVLSTQAKIKSGAEADALYSQAYSKFAAALQSKPDFHEVLNNWGNVLSDQANIKSGAEADVLYNSAYEKYIAALQIKPDYYEALHDWGIALSDQAQTKSGEEADTLYNQAYEKYARALQIKPDKYEVFVNWSNALLFQYRVVSDNRKPEILLNVIDKCEKGELILPGSCAYYLASVYSLLGNSSECQNWLEKSWKYEKLPELSYIESDSDLDMVRDQEWFKEFIAKLRLSVAISNFPTSFRLPSILLAI